MPSEFDLIARYFTRPAASAGLGIGDDAALVRLGAGVELAISTDMLVAGRHFDPDVDPVLVGHKTLAVNLSDLAAMGATPRWALLAIALPEANEAWLAGFCAGFFALAERFNVELIGGDTTRGPLNLCVTILGEVEGGQALRRDGAKAGDDIWVSGQLGGAALALRERGGEVALDSAEAAACRWRLDAPEPRVALGRALRGLAHAAIDVSDGLLADLGHILDRSGVGAEIALAEIPAEAAVAARLEKPLVRDCLLAGGDDYELCFTAPVAHRSCVLVAAGAVGVPVKRIGRILSDAGVWLRDPSGQTMRLEARGYDHFAA